MLWLSDLLKKRERQQRVEPRRIRILTVSISLEEIFLLERLGDRHGWDVRFTPSPHKAFRSTSHDQFDLILCDHHQSGYPWREVMDRLAHNSPHSFIFLVSPNSDDHLWWDVLDHGGFDVLIHPLRRRQF